MLDLSIIVVNWNTRDLLRQCLEAVYSTVHNLEFEIWVVDNASTDGSPTTVREEFPQVRLIENTENLGFARANNQALGISSARYALLLNSDAFLLAGAAEALVSALDANPRAGIAGARLEYPGGRAQRSYGKLPNLAREVGSLIGMDKWNRNTGDGKCVIAVGAVHGACLLARRAMLAEIGLLDERFFMFSEEVDLCKRAWLSGWQVLHMPNARVVHIGGASSDPTSTRVINLYHAKIQYFYKHNGEWSAKMLLYIMRAVSWLKSGIYNFFDPSKAQLWRHVSNRLGKFDLMDSSVQSDKA